MDKKEECITVAGIGGYDIKINKKALNLGLIAAATILAYSCGRIAGELIDQIPYINEWIPHAVNYISGIDVKSNLDGVGGLVGIAYGLKCKPSIKISEEKPHRIKKIKLGGLLEIGS